MAENIQSWLDQVKEDAARLTRQRMTDNNFDAHAAKETEVNTREGVTAGTPVRTAALVNPSEPDLENFHGKAESTLSGEKPSVDTQANTPSNQVDAASEAPKVKVAPKATK